MTPTTATASGQAAEATSWLEDAAPVVRKTGAARRFARFSRNRLALVGVSILAVLLLAAVFAPWIVPYPDDVADAVNFDAVLLPPSLQHWMGTDEVGRDVLTRVVFGARWSLSMAAIVLAIAVTIGVPMGLFAGYYGGAVEQVLMRVTDGFSAVPALVLALAITVLLGPSLLNAMIAIGFVWWRSFARIAHGQTLSKKQEAYVAVARSLGASDLHIMFREILPNISSALLVSISLNAGYAVLTGTALSFLGAGARPPTPEWGAMVADSRNYLPDAWWASLFPGLAIFVTVVSFNLLGDGLRDYFAEE
ncbi:MAG: ABC transporter permease [Proteobacteria bacterium]|nr:ABC transporter permease [Pseudomonadota bacterium]